MGSELRPLESLAGEFCFLPSSDFARFPTLVVRIQGLCLLRLLQGQKAQFLIETAEFDAFRELLFSVLPFPVYRMFFVRLFSRFFVQHPLKLSARETSMKSENMGGKEERKSKNENTRLRQGWEKGKTKSSENTEQTFGGRHCRSEFATMFKVATVKLVE